MIGGQNGLIAIRAHLSMAAIVQQDYVATANLALDLFFDRGGRGGIPVEAGNIPHNRLKA